MELSSFQVRDLVYTWFRKLTDHAPLEEMQEMLSSSSLTMRFPEATIRSHEEFRQWYETVIRTYFDQLHELKMLDISIAGDGADVRLVVNWQARSWNPPDGYSHRLGLFAHQTWRVVLEGDRAVIAEYSVERTVDMQGPVPVRV